MRRLVVLTDEAGSAEAKLIVVPTGEIVAICSTLEDVLVAGDYLTPQLVGGSSGVTLTSTIHDLFGAAFDWPTVAALAWVLLTVLAATVALAAFLISLYRTPLIASDFRFNLSPKLNALAMLIVLFNVLVIVLSEALRRRAVRRRSEAMP